MPKKLLQVSFQTGRVLFGLALFLSLSGQRCVQSDDIDIDQDGVPDHIDGCVYDANKTDPGDCGCGVPEGTCGNSCDPITNFSGTWLSTYSCTDSCDPEGFSGSNPVTIQQSGDAASYTDTDGAVFTGTVCGKVWTFARVADSTGETETGTLTLNSDGTATRQSHWSASPCEGDCTDFFAPQP